MLGFVAGAAVALGVLVASPIFWVAAGSVFFLASAGIIAWAAKQLGIVAELLELFRTYRKDASAA